MRDDKWTDKFDILMGLENIKNKKVGGPILFRDNGENYVENSESHTIVLGSSGTGKSRRYILPMLHSIFEANESAIVIDPKGECYRLTSYINSDTYQDYVIDFRDVFRSTKWNPLGAIQDLWDSDTINEQQRARELINQLATALFPANSNDPFWSNSAKSLFVGLVNVLMESNKSKKRQITILDIYKIVIKGDDEIRKLLTEFPNSIGIMNVHSYITTANDTRGGIRSTFLEGLNMFSSSEGLISMLSGNELKISEINGNKKFRIFIIIPDETPIYNNLAAVLCNQLINHFVNFAQENPEARLMTRLNIVIEELGNIGKSIGNLPFLMSASRSRNIRMHLVLQSLSQLEATYGAADALTIRENADILVAFRTTNITTLKELSEKCGERMMEINGNYQRESLITPSQLGAMEVGQALVMIRGRIKFITWMPDYSVIFDTGGWKPPVERAIRINLISPANSKENTDTNKNNNSSAKSSLEARDRARRKQEELFEKIDTVIDKIEIIELKESLEKNELAILSCKHILDINLIYSEILNYTDLDLLSVINGLRALPFKIKFKSKRKMRKAAKYFGRIGMDIISSSDKY